MSEDSRSIRLRRILSGMLSELIAGVIALLGTLAIVYLAAWVTTQVR